VTTAHQFSRGPTHPAHRPLTAVEGPVVAVEGPVAVAEGLVAVAEGLVDLGEAAAAPAEAGRAVPVALVGLPGGLMVEAAPAATANTRSPRRAHRNIALCPRCQETK